MSNDIIIERYSFTAKFQEFVMTNATPSKRKGLVFKQWGRDGDEAIIQLGSDDMATLYLAMKKYYAEREYLL